MKTVYIHTMVILTLVVFAGCGGDGSSDKVKVTMAVFNSPKTLFISDSDAFLTPLPGPLPSLGMPILPGAASTNSLFQ
jgi:hypothetical protein